MTKTKSYGISGKILQWIVLTESQPVTLAKRFQMTTVMGLQCSLSKLHFATNTVSSSSVISGTVLMFANHSKLVRIASCDTDCEVIQNDLAG